MWDAFFARRNFYSKCKSALRMVNTRMEIIKKKRSATQKFLKNDVADLLKSNLDQNAYGRAQGLYLEMNLTWCYNYVHECCTLVTDNNLKVMQTEIDCPEECKVAVASLSYAAARFADLPELRDLRSLFTEKYGNALDPYINKEFVEKLKLNPPTREEKLKLMKDIAEEFSISWNPASFEQYLQDNRAQQRVVYEQTRSNNASRYKEDNRMQQRVVYEQTPSNNASGYKEADQTRPYTSNRVNTPYAKLKDKKEGESEESTDHEEAVMDKMLRHYSMKSWRKTSSGDRTDSPTGTYGRSVSMYVNHMHPKLPDCDELASRIQALKKM